MSLLFILNKDTVVYDKLNHFINDPRFIALMETYKQSDAYKTLDDLYFSSSTNKTRIKLTPSKTAIHPCSPKTNENHTIMTQTYMPIATVNIENNKLTIIQPNCHYIIDRNPHRFRRILYPRPIRKEPNDPQNNAWLSCQSTSDRPTQNKQALNTYLAD